MKSIDMKATGENIRKRCDQQRVAPEDLSRLLNLDASTPYYWFQGKTLPRWDIAVTLADILECRIDDLIITTREDDENGEEISRNE